MEIYRNKAEMMRKMKFPHYQQKGGFTSFLSYLVRIFVWLLVFCGVMIALYVYWFQRSLVYLLNLVQIKNYVFPFWLALLLTLIVFPFTVGVILVASLIKIIK